MPRKQASPSTLEITKRNGIGIVALNRPDVHNAFNETLIAELTAASRSLGADKDVRVVILTGSGPSFCAGADLNWMKKMSGYSRKENIADAAGLAEMLRTLNDLPKPTIARVHGNVFGGGVGLVACCDVAIAADTAKFGLTEARLGLIPAVISPYVTAAIGSRHARRLFVTAEIFDSAEAMRIGLVHHVVAAEQLDATVDSTLALLAKGGPIAQGEAKRLALRSGGATGHSAQLVDAENVDIENAALIARLRVSAEGQEGLSAFLGKRPASWIKKE